ncbi:polysaccharide lyase family 8 super-sandwich domain-containing protein [Cohnella hashimotonis]|uniref:Polysaccharide lyase family 8 super-sandwich domain-containing protein n=1 Tax=Cohnella hashimotonis TaxID=2826895 RepID=A0ABT6TD30_9BACL|nr:polysaccharide lyase family 8 super-sandwich domain-containing protein [Cohnella hashimotonis]MDI4644476.1 polysaccharide lyase family 8 super-sandwich domain-containing protein [Cohnella hashimotonis]
MAEPVQRFVKKWLCLVLIGSMISSLWVSASAAASTSDGTNAAQEIADMKRMKQRMVEFYISKDIINDGTNGRVEWTFKSQAAAYLSSQKPDGSWADVDYASKQSAANGRGWPSYLALDRMQSMAAAFADPKSLSYHSEAMLDGIKRALDHWFTVKPTSTNWWENTIGTQLRLEKVALLCEGYLTATQASNIVGTLDSSPNTVDGANSSWYNQNYMYRGLLLEDAQNVRNAVDAFNVLSAVTTTVTGIQSDMSFFQHGKTNYTTGYGRSFARDMSFWAYVTSGTVFAYSQAAIDSLSSYLLDGTRYQVRGDVADLGMGMNGPDWPDYASAALTFYEDPMQWMEAANPKRASEFASFLDNIRRIGTSTSNGLNDNNMTQWQTLVSSHMRADYGITVKMSSSTVKGGEWRTINPGGYNLLYWTPQGATAIQRTGDEYRPVYPLMDWMHVPGTTAPYVLTKDGNFNNPRTFVGGVTNERYGATAFDFNKLSTSGKKGYFFFDDEMVALGAGIASTNAAPIHTTLNQSKAVGDVIVDGQTMAEGTKQTNGKWAYNDRIGYVFPNPTDFQVKLETKTGKWSDVVTGSSTEPITKPIFSIWLDHGVKPTGATYQYIVLPDKSAEEVGSYASDNPIRILSNTASVQAVRHETLRLSEMLFYQPGTVTVRDGLTVAVDKPAMVIVDESASPVRISVANPETPGITVNVTLDRDGEKTTTTYRLGKDIFAGRSVTLNEGAALDDSGFDLAYTKGAAASSSQGKQFASNATDLYRTSYWHSNASDDEWLYVDLQDSYTINKVRLKWESAYGKSYKIQVSNDAVAWTDVYATSLGDGDIDDISFGKVNARYVRMQGVRQGNANGYSLAEFNVYEAVAPNLAEGRNVVASSIRAADVSAGNAVDGSLTTRWGSNYTDQQSIYVDLGASQTIAKVVLHWEAAYGKEYQIQVSDNAADWTTVYSTANGDGDIDEIAFEPVNARYVKMNGLKRGSTYGYSLWEFKVYGAETAERIPARVELKATPSSATVGDDVSVSGVVYDGDGLPISGVAVEISASPGSADTVRAITDENGGFSHIYAAPGVAGDMTISVILPSSPSVTGTIVVPVKRAQQVPVRIGLQATPTSVAVGGAVSVTGIVYDGDDLPVAGVEVELAASAGGFEQTTAVTDENGGFSAIFKAPSVAGEVTITAALAANPSVANTIAVSVHEAVQVPARIELQATPSTVTAGSEASVAGVVYDGDDLPVPGVEVEVSASAGSVKTVRLVTDANGRFDTVYTAPSAAGEATITAALTAYPSVTNAVKVSVGQAEQVPVRIEMQAAPSAVWTGDEATVTGIVTDRDGLPVSGAAVELAASSGSIQASKATTDANGRFNVRFTAPSAAGEATITATLSKTPSVTGKISVSVHERPNGGNPNGGTVTPPAKPDEPSDGPDTPDVPGREFSDIAGHWAQASIMEAAKRGIITGYPDGSFRPYRTVTRAEFAVMLVKALKLQNEASVLSFEDADRIGQWARTAVAQAVSMGLIRGDANDNFRPDAPLTRSEMAVMLARALSLTPEAASAGFTDDRDIPAWAVGAAAEMKKLGIMQGKGGNGFFPNDVATRAETVAVLLRMLEAKEKEQE